MDFQTGHFATLSNLAILLTLSSSKLTAIFLTLVKSQLTYLYYFGQAMVVLLAWIRR